MTDPVRSRFREIILPFIIFTAVWGSTWIVIRGQLGTVAPQWSVAYRFVIAAIAMALIAKWKGQSLNIGRSGMLAALFIGISQFCINFNFVYLAERHITSGIVATVFALLIIPNSLLGWAFLGQRPDRRFALSSCVAIAGIGLLFVQELKSNPASPSQIAVGLAFTIAALLGASSANIFQALERVKRHHLAALLAWSMAIGATIDIAAALAIAGPPTFDPRFEYWVGLFYLALFASALAFSLYFPVVRKIGPAKAAYSSMLVPIIAMALSTLFEGYRWTPLAACGAALALAGMYGAMRKSRTQVASPDAG